MLEVHALSKAFGGVAAISDLDFRVEEGSVYAVIGPNGAGKTTLFNMLCGIYRPDRGDIRLRGESVLGAAPHEVAARGVSRTFQNVQVSFGMSVLENVMVGCHRRGRHGLYRAALRWPGVAREERALRAGALAALEFCGLRAFAERPAGALAYGDLKRVEIARALATRPQLLLMDEPAAGLNDTETREMRELIGRIRASGVTVLLVEHNMGLVMGVSDTVLVLDYGRRLAEGAPGDVQRDPRVVAAYLGGEAALG
jgi:branched-chain amino acid transport system ATP-binding protein